jgi:hypothetical protein
MKSFFALMMLLSLSVAVAQTAQNLGESSDAHTDNAEDRPQCMSKECIAAREAGKQTGPSGTREAAPSSQGVIKK